MLDGEDGGERFTYPNDSHVAVQIGSSTEAIIGLGPLLEMSTALAKIEGAMLLRMPPDVFFRFPEVVGDLPAMTSRRSRRDMWEIRLPLASGSLCINKSRGASMIPTPPQTWTVSLVAHAMSPSWLRIRGASQMRERGRGGGMPGRKVAGTHLSSNVMQQRGCFPASILSSGEIKGKVSLVLLPSSRKSANITSLLDTIRSPSLPLLAPAVRHLSSSHETGAKE